MVVHYTDYFWRGKYNVRRIETFLEHKIERPGIYWSSRCSGYYDTDEEVEQDNISGNVEGMIDGV